MTESSARKRPRRIAADEAHAWARNLRLRNPYAKLVLSMLTIYVNGEGSCFVGASTLAEDCELALETVRRRLAWLENIGAIARFPQWVDENGRRNSDGRGKRTTDDIRLMVSTDPEVIEARAAGEAEPNDDADQTAVSPLPHRGPVSDSFDGEKSPAPQLAPYQPPHCGGGLTSEPEPEPEDSPQSPPRGPGTPEPALYRIEDFRAAYPIPITNWPKFETIWRAMTQAECDDAITGARGYAALCRSQPNRAKEDAHRWLKNTKWIGYLEQGKRAETIAQRIEADAGSPQFEIWRTVLLIARRNPELPAHWLVAGSSGKRANLPKALPEAFIELANPNRTWTDVVEGDGGHFAAWLRWLHEILPSNFIVISSVASKRTLCVPDIWPPRKDGSLGPPKEDSNAA